MNTGVLNISDGNEVQTEAFEATTFTRAMSLGAGNVAITGIGFKPRAIIMFGSDASGGSRVYAGWGCQSTVGSGQGAGIFNNMGGTADNHHYTNDLVSLVPTVGEAYNCRITSWDADGFTINFSQTGSATDTNGYGFICFK